MVKSIEAEVITERFIELKPAVLGEIDANIEDNIFPFKLIGCIVSGLLNSNIKNKIVPETIRITDIEITTFECNDNLLILL
jgi:hypothetical protein